MKNKKVIIHPGDPITDAQSIRAKVFQEEQGIDRNLDFDGKDESSTHIVIYSDNIPVGTGRVRKIDNEIVKIERVAVIKKMRGKGIGKEIMQAIDTYISESDTIEATLDAQLHAKEFYEKLGFLQQGDVFAEVGIPHIVMVKNYKK